MPVLVLDRLGADAAAAYSMVWQFGLGLYMVPSGMGQSMIAHNAADPGKVDEARRETVRRGLLLVTPVAVVLARRRTACARAVRAALRRRWQPGRSR